METSSLVWICGKNVHEHNVQSIWNTTALQNTITKNETPKVIINIVWGQSYSFYIFPNFKSDAYYNPPGSTRS